MQIKKRYKNIVFKKDTILKITGSYSLEVQNINFAILMINRLYQIGFPCSSISGLFGIGEFKVREIISLQKLATQESMFIHPLKNYLGKRAIYELFNTYKPSRESIDRFLKKTYRLYQKLGNYESVANKLNISINKTHKIFKCIKESNIIKNFKRPLKNNTKNYIIYINKLYNELGCLTEVAKKLGLSRERIRQILEKGDSYGIINYKAPVVKRFDELSKEISKKDLEYLLIKLGSKGRVYRYLKEKYNVGFELIKKLIELYEIDINDINISLKRNEILRNYKEIVQELGYHPTTTIMKTRPKWRALWARIQRIWGTMDNFRKEYGIPIPAKGNPRFREISKNKVEALKFIKSERMQKIIKFIEKNSPTNSKQICQQFNLGNSSICAYLKELRERSKIGYNFDGQKYIYFAKR